jgi:hypothetical protein
VYPISVCGLKNLRQESPMSSTFALPAPVTPERIRRLPMDSLRLRALERLYLRRDAVDDLIRGLEKYEDASGPTRGDVVSISVGRKCSSGSARLRT